ncbi:MAG: hypothetical protein R6V57_08620 [Vicinamibacterales bacterium]
MKTLHFSVDIRASRKTVWEVMLAGDSYRLWTAEFAEGSYFQGAWETGTRMRFLVPSGEGMVAEVAEHRPQEFLSLRHIGLVKDGVEDTESEMVKAWGPAFENYTLSYAELSSHLAVDIDVTPEFEEYMSTAWPKALAKLKRLCEDGAA